MQHSRAYPTFAVSKKQLVPPKLQKLKLFVHQFLSEPALYLPELLAEQMQFDYLRLSQLQLELRQ
jgi:hypothetical protein